MTSSTENAQIDAHRYTAELAAGIEHRWQDRWEQLGTFHAATPGGDSLGGAVDVGGAVSDASTHHAAGEKFFLLDMFPYPSGKGLHVGHPLGYIATDVVGRYHRMKGRNVLHALGYDAFGLPAEQFAVQTGQHPRITTEQNVANMRRQLRRLGLAHDARRSFSTTDEDFVRWTQWIFRTIFTSWYDAEAPRHDGGTGTARPIADLVEEFEAGTRQPADGSVWADLDAAARRRVVDGYRLAYISEAPVNWCPGLGTVLANEEVTADGRSERGNYPVFQRNLRQWMLRITAYGDRLIDDLDLIDWPEKVRSMQRNWIGRSEGAHVDFPVAEQDVEPLTVFTTRPDTLFGATFMAVSPEHPLVSGGDGAAVLPQQWPAGTREAWTGGSASPREAVAAYQRAAASKTDEERQDDARAKTGVFTGLFGVNPVNDARVPIFVADYVLMGYGTGAIMAVPAHDERDFAFAQAYELPIVLTIAPPAEYVKTEYLNAEGGAEGAPAGDVREVMTQAWTGDGAVVNSATEGFTINGLGKDEAKATITAWLERRGIGVGAVTYRLRDWLFSRQRYWGEPFPVVYDADGNPRVLPESMLPVSLPEVPDYSPRTFEPDDAGSSPEPPLGRVPDWVNVELDLGDGEGVQTYRRDTNTMPQWAGSSWYVLRYLDPRNEDALVDPAVERYWMGPREGNAAGGADLYVGGVEHAVLHLLYARFWHKVLYDLGHVSSIEPFHTLFNQGYIQAYAYSDARGQYVNADHVVEDAASPTGYAFEGAPVNREYGKMGKSLKNIVTPDDMYDAYGADTFRVYEMSMGPLDVSRPWNTRDVVGAQRFLQRLWRNVVDEATGEVTVTEEPAGEETRREVARAVDAVTTELDHMRVNTAIAKMIVLNNHLTTLDRVPREAVEPLVLMVAPVAPHVAEELWARLGHAESLAYEPFPVADPALLVEDTVTCVVQVKGKVRDRLEVPADVTEEALRELALASEKVAAFLEGEPRKVIVRAPGLVNVVP